MPDSKAISPDLSEERIETLADKILSFLSPEAQKGLLTQAMTEDYRDDPIGFCENVLKETLTEDVKKLIVSVRDNPVTVAISANATGKTHGAARASVWFYLCHSPSKVFTAAAPPLENLKNALWGEIGSVVRRNPDLFEGQVMNSLDIRRSSDEFLTGVTIPSSGTAEEREAKFSGKHQKYLLFVIDEGDAVPDEVYKGIESCMSGGFVRLLVMFNPRRTSGAVYRMIQEGNAHVVHLSAFSHPNVVTGRNVIPGAVTREVTVRRINLWSRPFRAGDTASSRSTYQLPPFLVGSLAKRQDGTDFPPLVAGKYKITNPALSYMVLGQYPAQGSNQLISEEWISAARSRYDLYTARNGDGPPEGAHGIMGLDIAEMGADSNVAVGRYGGYVTKFSAWGGVDPSVTEERAVAWYRAHKGITRANVDATGVGAGVAPHMQKAEGIIAVGVKVASAPTIKTDIGDFRILRDELLWRVREWLRTDPGAMIPPDKLFLEELQVPTYCTDTGKVEVMPTKDMKAVLGRSPDHLMSFAMTFAGSGGFFDDLSFQAFPEG